jgi:hypothetical protein
MSTIRRCLAAAALIALAAPAAAGAERSLIMFREVGCRWCETWDAEVGGEYTASALGVALPIRFLYLARDRDHGLKLLRPVRYTPTFVLVEDEREVGRIEGYPGEADFWIYLERLATHLGIEPVPAEAEIGSCTIAAEPCDLLD